MHTKNGFAWGFALFILLSYGRAQADGFSSFKMGPDARAGAMGYASVAFAQKSAACFWNPAGLASGEGAEFQFSMHRWVADVQSSFLSAAWGKGRSGFGAHLIFSSVGDIEYRDKPSPAPLFTFSAYDLIAGLSYARMLGPRMSLGASVKVMYEKIYIHEAMGVACDLGAVWSVWENGLRLGGTVQNLGTMGKLNEENIELPLTGRIGAAMPFRVWDLGCAAVLDLVKERGFPVHVHGGLETVWSILYFRVGYQTGFATRSWTGGVGLSWKAWRIDYGYMPLGMGLGDSHRITVTMAIR